MILNLVWKFQIYMYVEFTDLWSLKIGWQYAISYFRLKEVLWDMTKFLSAFCLRRIG